MAFEHREAERSDDVHDDAPPAKRARVEPEASSSTSSLDPNSLAYRLAKFSSSSAVTTSGEALVGISGYVNPNLPPFKSAIIKHRFTDFLVWEIAQGGEVVKLQDISRPVTKEPEKNENSNGKDEPEQEAEPEEVKLEDYMTAEKMAELATFVAEGKKDKAEMFSDPIESKDTRKAFHNAIRVVHEGKLSTEAKDGGVVRISWSSGGKDRRSVRPSKKDQQNLPQYIQFTLHKTNRETQDCISHLATKLGVTSKDLATAGTKDKRGVTTQLVTVKRFKRTIEEVWDQVNGLHHGRSRDAFRGGRGRGRGGWGGSSLGREGMIPKERGERGLRIGDLKYVDKPLDLGMLDGNRFCIVLRDVHAPSSEVIESSLATLQNTGFINFYGMQRFGNSSVPTHAIGLALLRSEWNEAARLILSERDGDSEELLDARKQWNVHRNAKRALDSMPRWLVAERSLIEFYQKNGGDSNQSGALGRIPKNLRMMYVHAYQSYLWNSVTSERIRLYGCEKPVSGDLVYAQTTEGEEATDSPANHGRTKITKESVLAASKGAKVKVLTEEEVDKYTIHDVLLPLPGYNITYPGGELGNMYRQMMKADGLDADDMFRTQKEFSLGGAYRKILLKPSDLVWEKLYYSDPNHPLAQPDEDALLGIPHPPPEEDGDKLALKVTFGLDTAAYATMALREVLKSETGNVQQRAMTEAMLDKHATQEAKEGKKELENGANAENETENTTATVEEIAAEPSGKQEEVPAIEPVAIQSSDATMS